MQGRPHDSRESEDRRAIEVDVKLFQLALRSYPELFRREPAITFEQHFLSLMVAAQSDPRRTQTTAKKASSSLQDHSAFRQNA